ncbi:MAG: hypothetical protein Q8R28_15985 [Dehalococcoidia bacterium]|nr:hypothetical protein [Dehalococcoidia bacterium]
MDVNDLDYVAANHECPDCLDKSRLAVRWNGKEDEVVCHGCGRTQGFQWRESLTALWWRNPEALPVAIANRLAEKYREQIEAVAEGLPPELADVIREKYFGLPIKKEEHHANQGTD